MWRPKRLRAERAESGIRRQGRGTAVGTNSAPAWTAARIYCRGQAAGRGEHGHGLAVATGAPRGRPQGYVAADERQGGGSTARRRRQDSGMVVAIGAPCGQPQGYIAGDEQRGGEAAGRRRCCLGGAAGRRGTAEAILAPHGWPRRCVALPRGNVAADKRRGGGSAACRQDGAVGRPRNRRPARMAVGVCRLGGATGRGSGGPPPGWQKRSSPRKDSCGIMSPQRSGGEGGDSRSDRCPRGAAASAGQPRRSVHGRGCRIEKTGRQRRRMGEAGEQADRRRMAGKQAGGRTGG